MKGQIDEVRIWNVCRTAQEIKDNRYKTVYANNTGLVGYYKFNEPASADARLVTDYSGSHNDGRLYSSSSGITIDVLPNCTATKIPASIKFGDFSYSWSNGATVKEIKPANAGSYTYTVKDSATGCSATSDPVSVKMNATANITKTIAKTTTQMPYNYNENGINLTFNDADFINDVATKPFISTPTNGPCQTITTVTVTKSDCINEPIQDYGGSGTAKNLSNITICDQLNTQIQIKGPESGASNIRWETVGDPGVVTLTQMANSRVSFQNLTFNRAGNAKITYYYTYNSISCSTVSNITVSPITVTLSTSPSNILTNTASPTLTGTPAGGEWISSDYTKARMLGNTDNANSSTRTLQYIGGGSVIISYKITTSGSNTCLNPVIATKAITVQ